MDLQDSLNNGGEMVLHVDWVKEFSEKGFLLYVQGLYATGEMRIFYQKHYKNPEDAVYLSIADSYTNVSVGIQGNVHFRIDNISYVGGSWVNEEVLVRDCDDGGDRYRFGFNGQAKVNEIAGMGNHLDFGARIYDSRVSRFLSLDPLMKKIPYESNYIFAGNSTIYLVDKDGKYKVSAENEVSYRKNYPLIMKYLSTQIENDISNSTKIISGLITTNPNIQPSTVKGISKWGFGPEIVFKDAPGEFPMEFKSAAGFTEKDMNVIQMNAGYANYVEKVLTSDVSSETKQAVFTRFYMTIIHETAHQLNKYGKSLGQNEQGNQTYQSLPKGYSSDEQGYKAEESIWGTDSYKPFTNPSLDDGEGVQGINSEKYMKGVTEGVIREANKTEEGRKSLPTVPNP